MIDFTTIDTALKAWVTAVTLIERVIVNGYSAKLVDRPYCELSYFGINTIGVDELRYEYDATAAIGKEMLPWIVGQRVLTVTVRIVSRANAPANAAPSLAEKLRASLKFPAYLEILQDAGVAVNHATDVGVTVVPFQDRTELHAIFDLQLNVLSTLEPTAEQGIGYIEQVEVSGELYQGDTEVGSMDTVINNYKDLPVNDISTAVTLAKLTPEGV